MASTSDAVVPSAHTAAENRDGISSVSISRGMGRYGTRGSNRRRNPDYQDVQHPSVRQMRSQAGEQGRGAGGRHNALGRRRHPGTVVSKAPNQLVPPLDPPPGLGGGGTFGGRLTIDAIKIEGEILMKDQDSIGEEDEAEVCFICASLVVHHSVAPCNHRTCHICALRLRALYKTRACAHCRSEASHVIFTDDANKRFEDFTDADFQKTDEVLGIRYEHKEIYNDTLLLLRYNCPDNGCDIACWGWPDLHKHVKGVHNKILCDLCTRNKKVFTHEHELFTNAELRKHEKFGDDNPGAVDQSGFKGHPECGFCRQRFYGDDELYAHCRDKHEKCHICDRRNHGRQQQYYVNYDSLELHFRKDHFLCADQDCLDKKFVVFDSEMDLKAHQLDVHPNDLSKDARKDARRVDISAFDYRTPFPAPRGGRRDRDGRGNGRGRDPNTEAIPQSTAQPLRRDELAYQRQMAIQSAQSVSTRTFGGQLTSNDTTTPRQGDMVQEPPVDAVSRSQPFLPIETLDLNAPTSPSPREQARHLQHASVMDRASTMLQNDPSKLSTFRSTVSSYQNSLLTASQLLDTFFTLFDVPSKDLGKLIRELADIYQSDEKRQDLLKAWNGWRAINEDYPSLPGPGGLLPGSSTATTGTGGGSRVLKLKSSTAQSSRSAVSKQSSWGSAAPPPPFPPISTSSANRAGAGRVGPTPWIAPSASSSSMFHPRPSSRLPVGPLPMRSSAAAASDSMFPALPVAAKPNTFMAGLTRGTVRWDDGRGGGKSKANANAWGAGGVSSGNPSGGDPEMEGEDGTVTGRKKGGGGGKGKKVTLYKLG